MFTAKASLVLLGLVAGVCLAQAAGGIKGQLREDSQQRLAGLKGSRVAAQQQQQYQEPPQPIQQQPIQQQQVAIKGPGQIAPVFTPARVQQILPPPPPPAAAPIIEQQIVQQEQQQVQEPEIDPNAAAQDSAAAVIAPSAAAPAASEEEANPRPEPYAFNYAFEAGDSATAGSSQREETQDANGKVTGFYTLRGEDGRDRRVDYVADANGFRATISTNEMGTAPKDAADAIWQAQAPSDAQLRAAEAATQAARLREASNPSPANNNNHHHHHQQQQPLASASASSQSKISPSKVSPSQSSRQNIAAAKSQQQQQQQIQQLQEPFEQIRQTELNGRARKSRHAPFYLFTI